MSSAQAAFTIRSTADDIIVSQTHYIISMTLIHPNFSFKNFSHAIVNYYFSFNITEVIFISKKSNSISDQIAKLEQGLLYKDETLKLYEKSVDKLLKSLFGKNKKSIDKLIENSVQEPTDFETKICLAYNLKTDADKEDFLRIMCGDSSIKFFESHRH